MKKLDWKYILASISLFVGFIFASLFKVELMNNIKMILTYPFLNLYAGAISTIFTILEKYKSKKISFHSKMTFGDFKTSVSELISFIDNPIILVGSLGLTKGLFLYYSENTNYFPFLNSTEILLVVLVTIYLLYTSLSELWTNIIRTYLKQTISNEIPVATNQEDLKNKEIPKPKAVINS